MSFHTVAQLGQWYRNRETGDIFEVVAMDYSDGYIEVQFFAGEIEGYDIESWEQTDLIEISEPEDWSGPYEMTREDIDYSDNPLHPENWSGALSGIEPETEDWYEIY